MSFDGRDGSLGDDDGEAEGAASPQVPSQGGRAGVPHDPVAAGIPAQGGEPVEGSVPAQRDRREDGGVPHPPKELPPSDADLIDRMRSGDDTAYEALYRRHAGAVRRYARTCCRDGHTADDLTAEVFARMLQAVRRGMGPEHAVRAYLLTTVRRVAASWTKSAKREQLVDDFAVFAAQSTRASELSDDGAGLDLGADVRAMHEAEQSMAMRAFRSLPERWQAVLWHTEVEDESPSEVATLFGLDANGTRVLASRAREGLKQAYLQAHVSAALADDEECARYADRLGAYVRGGLRTRAERGLRKHLEGCAKCWLAAGQIKDVAGGIPAVVPVAVIGWFGAAGYAKAVGIIADGAGAGAAGAAGVAAGGGGSSGGVSAGGGATSSGAGANSVAASEGLGATVKAGVAAGVVAVAAVAVTIALAGGDDPPRRPDAKPPASAPVVEPADPTDPTDPTEDAPTTPGQGPAPEPPLIAAAAALAPTPAAAPAPPPKRPPTTRRTSPVTSTSTSTSKLTPTPSPPPPLTPTPKPTPAPTPPSPAPPPAASTVFLWSELSYDISGDGTEPEMRIGGSSWVWQRFGVSIADKQYTHGVTVHGNSSVTIDLNRECTAYDALVGVDDMTAGLGKVDFTVYADGVRLWRSGSVEGGESAVPAHVDLAGRETVRLVVEPHSHLDDLTLADWAESRFTCS
ncbi:sigma-70 family RNA polymerase sigma factor [Streptomyces sp. NPDC006332]|uniref:sigma-70 family RNA polymerase sigma factor n=1 Tax=Streptomyces sp. NPDC006332 TaxID=3155456 RepID=UPI00339E31B4